MTQTPILSVDDLRVTFAINQGKKWPWSPANSLHAVNGVSFDLHRGQTLGIVGESGCGKSTLIRAIAGLVAPSGGTVRLDGTVVDYQNRASLQDLRKRMQMIFQDPIASLNPRMTIRDIVSEPLAYFRPEFSAQERKQATRDILDRVGIPERNFNRFPHEFSGGQCQRIGIARALVSAPQILLCDEPVSALDVSIQAQVINLLKDLQAEMGLTLIFVAHDLGVVRHISDDVLVLYLGGVMEKAPAGEVVDHPRHPYSQALLSAVPVPDPRVKTTPQVLDGDLPSPLALPQGCLFQSRCPKRIDACRSTRPALKGTDSAQVACLLEEV
ncbi:MULTISPECIES: ABC transporter ATP-binding protein [unclassified Epibacterium]|jgi:oligopeptide transport system ATP-binding protein|uniref:ABC transporter ATP-binding protein n=1 Tax=unclassified Epibacterium TaxID=2639179 RepID=UPI001EF593D8|nr:MULTISPECIES: oligopeptide/dipeptide ABC transporter ATP-binding protein [unclassified Epibacterium]MCG7624752.1 ATP-binding cassette domain-containing protein [Epibacterium sp. Ofav1-8]MCG7628894.1 ATP-binding cassette domain-containing protein [Epibacterium sp. MM17-32]